jgi:hypothetical protein
MSRKYRYPVPFYFDRPQELVFNMLCGWSTNTPNQINGQKTLGLLKANPEKAKIRGKAGTAVLAYSWVGNAVRRSVPINTEVEIA